MLMLLLMLTASGSPPTVVQASAPAVLRIRAYADRRVVETVLARAVDVARELLTAAGVATTWRVCVPACEREDGDGPEAVVILSSWAGPSERPHCGTAHLGTRVGEGTVMVSVPCVAGSATHIARRLANRLHPLLATGRHDDLVGAVVAHEIGHVLGLSHGRTGLMRARLDATDVIALRSGSLAFTRQEAARMRARAQSVQARGR